MSNRDWLEKDFYRELGVAKDASADEIKKAYRKIARENHPDAKPGDTKAEAKFKAAGEAYGVLSDATKRQEYDEARTLFSGGRFGGFGGGGRSSGGGQAGGFEDLFGGATRGGGGGAGGLGDLLGGIFGGMGGMGGTATDPTGGAGAPGGMGGFGGGVPRQRRGADVETEVRIDFGEAVNGATLPLRLTSPMTCGTCDGSGAKPGTTPRTCVRCGGAGLVSRSQGAFAFSEPCPDCRGTGHLVDDPCPECGGDGVSSRPRTLTIRIPAGVEDGQRIRLAGKGQPGPSGGPAGDLYVIVHVAADAVFGRSSKNPDDLTLGLPVTYPELVRGATVTVPTIEGRISLKVPAGSSAGRTLRVRGRGVKRKDRTGDLLVTLELAVPSRLSAEASDALDAYAKATADHDPRAHLTERADRAHADKEAAS
ncbi:DnaJ C-terminal domain-containing protein [Actinomycetospora termitidis]|uniref:Chaperone protein DnaJ n=1 Tax=Actinomycetospora termitidis TaxID=3053470 RepID=A0ABT7M306_9PSEU|nr:DnaJ C-terminal domain-containing protein [Actinomycetospora sp. Odt1-22]MDL5155050.1 DnaJ C-terminal domain-containing protein [Actinomycetospora sp. Odt1-22]